MAESPILLQLQNYLSTQKSDKGKTLKQHFNEFLTFVLHNKQVDLYHNFEQISSFVKQSSFNYKEPLPESKVNSIQTRKTHLSGWVSACNDLLQKPKKKTDQDYWVETKPTPLGVIPNLLSDYELFRWAGIDFGEEEIYRLQMSLKRLMNTSGASELRFWGKLFGISKSYYVIEGILPGGGKESAGRPRDLEPRGRGVNKLTYWVADNVLDDWIELPNVTPAQIQAAKNFKKLLSGDLNAAVDSYPSFPGKERHLLRAQIARITHATVIVPKGVYKLNEEDPYIIETEEEISVPGYEELLGDESWLHLHPKILSAGRVQHAEPEVLPGEEVDPEEIKAKLMEEDPEITPLRGISEDDAFPGHEKCWVIKLIGDSQQYALKDGEGNNSYGVNVLRSLRWPGAVTVYKSGKWANIYVGDGIKAGQRSFFPAAPEDMSAEPEDPTEQFEPHPKEAPESLESDTDEEKKPDEEEDEY